MALEYDNSAFYYFAITLLTIYLIPGVWFALSEIFRAFVGSGDEGSTARTKVEKAKAEKLKTDSTGFARLKKSAFLINLCVLMVVIPLFIYLVTLVRNDGEVNTFDPFQILGVEQGAKTAIIKSAYRKLSLQYHPDKNPGNKNAEEMFMKIAKAYEALTDENSKSNFEKYGNPDGKQSLEISIGLPRVVLDNPKVVLVLYLLVMVVVIPVVVGLWYSNSKKFGEKNIMYETYKAFYELLQESDREKEIPEVLAASAEFRALNVTKPGDNDLNELYGELTKGRLMEKPKHGKFPQMIRGNLLIHAHLHRRTGKLTEVLRKDLDKMLSKAPELIEGLIEIAHQRKWLAATLAIIRFSQCVAQGQWFTEHSLLQLPHFTDEEIAKCVKKDGKSKDIRLHDFLREADKPGLEGMTDEAKREVLSACELFPKLKIDTTLFVEEEEGDDAALADQAAPVNDGQPPGDRIFEQDLVHLRVTLTRENLAENVKEASPAHAPLFPRAVREGWWLILTDKPGKDGRKGVEPNIHCVEKIRDQGRVVTHELHFMAPPRAGSYAMELHILSDCYRGLDEKKEIKFDVSPAAELPVYRPHQEDVDLDNEPTLFEQVMANNIDDSSDDDDDDDKEEDTKKPAANPVPGKKTSSRVIEMADEGSD